ncbi:MAG: hypothetical protein WCL49_10030 [bacterium]
MKKILLLLWVGLAAGCATNREPFRYSEPKHVHMQALIENAMGYINPKHGLFDKASGYPVEGWNNDPSKGLFLRSFTQLTAIGEWMELLATVAAGDADNPYVSRKAALLKLERVVDSLLADQVDPTVSAKGLLGNFLGFQNGKRLGPLGEDVTKAAFVEAFGVEKANQIWSALIDVKWLKPVKNGTAAKISRTGQYGWQYFTGVLEPFADTDTRDKVMKLLDERVVKIIFGDNVNLTASVAKSIGALLHPGVKDQPRAIRLREKMERFVAAQKPGFEHLFDAETETFIFGWDASKNQFVGWDNGRGGWVVGHQNYFINEFRGPLMLCLLRYNWPIAALKNSGFKIKPYRMQDGRDLYTASSWHGSSFQALGLSLFMDELGGEGWRKNFENVVDVEIDFAQRKGNPGFLSESYSGNREDYTGDVGIPEIAVVGEKLITDAPSLYTLGVSYAIAPEKVEAFLAANWDTIKKLFTDHGPWEGYKTTGGRVIKFQTAAHTLSLILGGIGSSNANMKRYLQHHGLEGKLAALYCPGEAFDFLDESVEWILWSAGGDQLIPQRNKTTFRIQGEKVRTGGLTIVVPRKEGISLSNGTLNIRYRAVKPIEKAVLTLKRAPGLLIKPMAFENEILMHFEGGLGAEKTIEIPMPGTPGLANVKELVLVYGDPQSVAPVDLTITALEYIPAKVQSRLGE